MEAQFQGNDSVEQDDAAVPGAVHPFDIFRDLPRDALEIIVLFLPSNEVACTLRLVCKAAAAQLRTFTNVRLSQPSPPHAFRHRWAFPGALRAFPLQQRLHLLCLSATSGCTENLATAIHAAGILLRAEVMEAAAAAAHLHVVEWLHHRGWPWGQSLAASAHAGHLEVCRWMLAHGCPWDDDALPAAARGGRIQLLEWLLTVRPVCVAPLDSAGVLVAAAEGCHLPSLQALYGKLLPLLEQVPQHPGGVLGDGAPADGIAAAAAAAAAEADVAMVDPLPQELQQLQPPQQQQQQSAVLLTPRQARQMLAAAAGSSTVDWRQKVEWLEAQASMGLRDAAGHMEQQRQLHPTQLSSVVCTKAAYREDAATRLAWLSLRGYQPHAPMAAVAAAASGNMDTLQCLLSQVCTTGGQHSDGNSGCGGIGGGVGAGPPAPNAWLQASRTAAKAGHRAILQALNAAGCLPFPGDDMTLISAASGGNLATVKWLVKLLGSDGPGDDNDRHKAGNNGDVDSDEAWAAESASAAPSGAAAEPPDYEDGRVLNAAARSGNLALVAWLHRQGYKWNGATVASAAEGGCEEALEWLVVRGCPLPTSGKPYITAASRNDIATMRCLRRLGCSWGGAGPSVMSHGLAKGFPLSALQWMIEAGCPVDFEETAAMVEFCNWRPKEYREQVLAWLALGAGQGISASEEGPTVDGKPSTQSSGKQHILPAEQR